jgi:flagellar biosynthesis protein FlhF
MKELVYKLSVHANVTAVPEIFKKYEQRLVEHEVIPSLASRIITQAMVDVTERNEELSESVVRDSIASQLSQIIIKPGRKSLLPTTKVVHFVGPTGVGKTTTIAKLAAEQVLKHNRKVGFITSDTYRIAAIEQLRTYATILNVPLEVVFSPQELNKAFQNLEDRDIIFMDTAGRNFRNELYVSELNSLLRTKGDSETFLVLSMTTKYRDMKAITDNFTKFNVDKVLFTKSDETDSYGAVVNLMDEFNLGLSYITHGQNVPDDINEVNEMKFIDMLLEDVIHE